MKKAKVLLYDIETSPNIGYTWGKWEQNVIEFKKEWELLSFAYKWLGKGGVRVVARPDFKDKTDKSLTVALLEIFNEADVIIGHNSDQFDNKKAKAKFVEHGLKPPSPYKTVDTKKIAKGQFSFNSNSLADLGQLLKLGKKLPTGGFSLWLKCMAGDKKAWAKMKSYNKQDVVLLEKVYHKLKAWAPQHPNLGVYEGKKYACPACASDHVTKNGTEVTRTCKYVRLKCQECGKWFRGERTK